jgi:hypothetical protein
LARTNQADLRFGLGDKMRYTAAASTAAPRTISGFAKNKQ